MAELYLSQGVLVTGFLQQAMLLVFAQKLSFWLMFLNMEVCHLAKGGSIFFNICVAYRYGKGNELCWKQPVLYSF